MGYSAGPQIGLADLIFSNSVSHLFCLIPTTSFFAFDRTAEKRSGATLHLPKLAAVQQSAGGWTRELMAHGKKLPSALADGPSLNGALLSFLFKFFSLLPRKHFFTKMQ